MLTFPASCDPMPYAKSSVLLRNLHVSSGFLPNFNHCSNLLLPFFPTSSSHQMTPLSSRRGSQDVQTSPFHVPFNLPASSCISFFFPPSSMKQCPSFCLHTLPKYSGSPPSRLLFPQTSMSPSPWVPSPHIINVHTPLPSLKGVPCRSLVAFLR